MTFERGPRESAAPIQKPPKRKAVHCGFDGFDEFLGETFQPAR